jgi:hypothetical protein
MRKGYPTVGAETGGHRTRALSSLSIVARGAHLGAPPLKARSMARVRRQSRSVERISAIVNASASLACPMANRAHARALDRKSFSAFASVGGAASRAASAAPAFPRARASASVVHPWPYPGRAATTARACGSARSARETRATRTPPRCYLPPSPNGRSWGLGEASVL